MDKSNILNTFTTNVDQLRNQECSQKEKIACFQQIAACIMSPALVAHINYATHCSTATNVLLLFCEDLDPTVRMSAEENLNKIFRSLEKTRVGRILLDLYGEIKRNGNQRSLRICLNLFSYYACHIKEKNVTWYAQRLLPCIQTIAVRTETLLCETLCEFVKNFGRYLQLGLTDSESCKLFEVFMANIGVECAVKRRCSSQNCISLIENSRNKSLMAKHGLNKVIELLLVDQQTYTILGALGFLRLLLPLIIRGFNGDCCDEDDDDDDDDDDGGVVNGNKGNKVNAKQQKVQLKNKTSTVLTTDNPPVTHQQKQQQQQQQQSPGKIILIITQETRQILEIYDYCLHLLCISNTSDHSIINAALEVINAILQAIDGTFCMNNATNGNGGNNNNVIARSLQQILSNQQLQQNEHLKRRKSLKNQIFQLKNYEKPTTTTAKPKMKSTTTSPRKKSDAEVEAALKEVLSEEAFSIEKVPAGDTVGDGDGDGVCKLGMQKIANLKMLPQQQQQQQAQDVVGIYVCSDATDVLATASRTRTCDEEYIDNDNDDDADDDEVRQFNANKVKQPSSSSSLLQRQRQQIRNSARSISECIEIDDDDDNDDGDDDDDGFTTLSEPQQTMATTTTTFAVTTTIDVDNLIDAIDATNSSSSNNDDEAFKEQKHSSDGVVKQESENLLTDFLGDDKSQNLSDIDNESFNSIDFDAEITIGDGDGGGGGNSTTKATTIPSKTAVTGEIVGGGNDGGGGIASGAAKSSSDTIGSFFNQLISHSNAASESVSKLFRNQSSTAMVTAPVNTATTSKSDKSDAASTSTATDNLSLISLASSSITNRILDADAIDTTSQQRKLSSVSSTPGTCDDPNTFSTSASATASTALLVDSNATKNTTAECSDSSSDEVDMSHGRDKSDAEVPRTPNKNPFLRESSPLKQSASTLPTLTLKIGTIYEQSVLFYTTRLVAARFLLTGQSKGLQKDATIRVSIKSLSLLIVGQCVRLQPQVLQLCLEITATELQLRDGNMVSDSPITTKTSKSSSSTGSPNKVQSDVSSNFGRDYEHFGVVAGDSVDFAKRSSKKSTISSGVDAFTDSLMLDIKDDHFGEGTSDYFLVNQPLSKSADPVLFADSPSPPPPLPPRNSGGGMRQMQMDKLSKSDIVEKSVAARSNKKLAVVDCVEVTSSLEDSPPALPPPRPPKRTKSIKKSTMQQQQQLDETATPHLSPTKSAHMELYTSTAMRETQQQQKLSDILLYYQHPDPMLRAGVQQIVGNFIQATGAGLALRLRLNLQHLLAILLKGLEDDIHTVVIQALNAFDKIFSHVVYKYLTGPSCHYQQQQQQQQQEQQKVKENLKEDDQKHILESAFGQIQQEQQQRHCYCTNDVKCASQVCLNNKRKIEKARTTMADKSCVISEGPTVAATASSSTYPQTLYPDNDELIAALLNAFQLQSNCSNDNENDDDSNDNNKYVDDNSYISLPAAAAAATTITSSIAPIFNIGNSDQQEDNDVVRFFISPKVLLSKLRLCHHNKYWLVQNKYAEVISNLNFTVLRSYYEHTVNCNDEECSRISASVMDDGDGDGDADDIVCTYENQFLDELLQLIGDDDFRVREHAAVCLCRFIIQTAKQHHQKQQQQRQRGQEQQESHNSMKYFGHVDGTAISSLAMTATSPIADIGGKSSSSSFSDVMLSYSATMETYQTNFNLLGDFFDYRIFSGMSPLLRNLFRANSSIVPPSSIDVMPTSEAIGCGGNINNSNNNNNNNYINGSYSNFVAVEFAMQRQMAQEEKVLAKVLYRMTNKLMALNDKNLQFGIIYTLRILLQHFNFIDFQRAWSEFNFMEICMKFCYFNYATAVDLSCQNDLIDVTGKLMAGNIISSSNIYQHQQQLDQLLVHTLKIINIYYHIFSNQKPLLFAKTQKIELFNNAKEMAIVQSVGYFGNDYVYIKLYNILRSANDSYKITINQEAGSVLISLLKTCLNTFSLCIELRTHSANAPSTIGANKIPPSPSLSAASSSSATTTTATTTTSTTANSPDGVYPSNVVLKLIEEILQYLSKLINYAPAESIACARQLLRYLYAQNYGNRQKHSNYVTFIQTYCMARRQWRQECANSCNADQGESEDGSPLTSATHVAAESKKRLDYCLFVELFAKGLKVDSIKSDRENDASKHIKLFEPLVIYSLSLFMKFNTRVQAPILELLTQLLEHDVNYSALDSKNVIFDQIIHNLDLIESGIARNGHIIIPPMIKFLIQLTHKNIRKLITIPKIISIANNLLANNAIRNCAVLALKSLAYEIFFLPTPSNSITTGTDTIEQRAAFQSPITRSPMSTPMQQRRHQASAVEDAATAAAVAEALLASRRELDTQKEVMLGMLEKFIDANECQQVLALLVLHERCVHEQQQSMEIINDAVLTMGSTSGCDANATTAALAATKGQSANSAVVMLESLLPEPGTVHAIVCRAMCESHLHVNNWKAYYVLDALFRNNGKIVLTDSKDFLSLLQLLITKDVANFCDLSYATIILANVILKTEEIYLVNHIKLYLKNRPTTTTTTTAAAATTEVETKKQSGSTAGDSRSHELHRMRHIHSNIFMEGPSTSSAAAAAAAAFHAAMSSTASANNDNTSNVSEINYFAKVLCEKLEACITCLTAAVGSTLVSATNNTIEHCDAQYCRMAVRFVHSLYDVCCRSRHKDALQSVFRLVLTESDILYKYYNLLMMHATPSTLVVCKGAAALEAKADSAIDSSALQLLQVEMFQLLSAMKLLDPLMMLQQQLGGSPIKRTLLREVCRSNFNPLNWKLQQVQQFFDAIIDFNILIMEHFEFVCNLCEVDDEFCSLLQAALLQNASQLNKHSIRLLLRLIFRLCNADNKQCRCSIQCIAKFLHILARLHRLHQSTHHRSLRLQIERLARHITNGSMSDTSAIYDSFIHNMEMESELEWQSHAGTDEGELQLQTLLLNDLENLHLMQKHMPVESCTIDEKWLLDQLIKFSTQTSIEYDAQQLTQILLEIKSENNLYAIFNNKNFDVARVLGHAVRSSLEAMLTTFRNNCVQYNPHIHYMHLNALARVSCTVLMTRITDTIVAVDNRGERNQKCAATASSSLYLCKATIALIECIKQIEATSLIYIESKFIDKFLREHLMRPEYIATLLGLLKWCCQNIEQLLNASTYQRQPDVECIGILLRCIDVLLQQKFIWNELNQVGKLETHSGGTLPYLQRTALLCHVLDVLVLLSKQMLQHTIFYRRYKIPQVQPHKAFGDLVVSTTNADEQMCMIAALLHAYGPKAIFIAKLIETKIDINATSGLLSTVYITGNATDGCCVTTAGSVVIIGSAADGSYSGSRGGGGGSGGGGVGNRGATGSGITGISAADGRSTDFEGIEDGEMHLNLLESIGISILRTNQFYAYTVTPYEVVQQQLMHEQADMTAAAVASMMTSMSTTTTTGAVSSATMMTVGKLPSIPLEVLSDVDVLRKFVKRLSIFGYTTKQQFEEYFTTFLLLINKVYDENMVDQQEQFQIRSTCLEAILELLITYKTFPIVGDKLSHFHHTTRLSRINCDSISLRKLHKVQLYVSDANVFYLPNLERQLTPPLMRRTDKYSATTNMADSIIGTRRFLSNQFDLNFVWQQMEAYAQPTVSDGGDDTISTHSGSGDNSDTMGGGRTAATASGRGGGGGDNDALDAATKNYRYFTKQSDVDIKSSTQLIFDVMMQTIESNYVLVLPNLVKFCEICESRDQIKWIKDKALKLQEIIPMDDTISHQHLIYLVCKTQAMLIPTFGELQQLCTLIGNYLKSSHVFIRNATLAGVLSLLECCCKTNTTIGKLSEELALLRDLIVGYINRHGIIDESPLQCSDTHTKLIWTLNFCLIEWTSKFVPQCHLLTNTIIAANNFLRRTNNEEIYLCVIHGLERMVVISTTNNNSSSGPIAGGGIVTPVLRNKIEKLALDLVKLENEKFSIPALKLLLSCIYMGSAKQLMNTELSNGIVQDDPEIIAQQTDKVDILLYCIKSSTRDAAWIYGHVLCQIIRDLVPPNEILTKVIKELLSINQPHCDVIAMIVYQVFRSAIDSSYLQMLQDWLIYSLPTFLTLPAQKGVWGLSVIFLSASIDLHLIKLFPVLLGAGSSGGGNTSNTSNNSSDGTMSTNANTTSNTMELHKLGHNEIALFMTAAQDFHAKLNAEQKMRFRDAFKKFPHNQIYTKLLQNL